MAANVARFPLVSREDILLAYRPGAEPSEGTFRTLRAHRVVSHGIGLRVRRRNRLAGQLRVYSALNLDAAVLARREETKQAQKVATKAGKQEERWEPKLERLLDSIGVENLRSLRELRNQLAHDFIPLARDVERTRKEFKILSNWLHESVGVLRDVTDTWSSLQLLTSAQEIVEVQRFLTDAAALQLGDLAVLRLERLQGASLVGIVPAVAEAEDSAKPPSLAEADEISEYLALLREPVKLDAGVVAELRTRGSTDDSIPVPPRTIRLAG